VANYILLEDGSKILLESGSPDALLTETDSVVPPTISSTVLNAPSLTNPGALLVRAAPLLSVARNDSTLKLSAAPLLVLSSNYGASLEAGAPELLALGANNIDGDAAFEAGSPDFSGTGQSSLGSSDVEAGSPTLSGTGQHIHGTGDELAGAPDLAALTSGFQAGAPDLSGNGPGPIAPVRNTQSVLEVIDHTWPLLRVTQHVLEPITLLFPNTKVTQHVLEVIAWGTIAPLTIQCPGTSFGKAGQPFDAFLSFSGGKPPYTFEVVAGALPSGLTLDPNTGEISGVIGSTAGAFYFTIRITDANGRTAEVSCVIFVAPIESNTPPTWRIHRFDTKIRVEDKS
jgi:hypothetical protein